MIQRYDSAACSATYCGTPGRMKPTDLGGWVRYADAAKLEAEVARLSARSDAVARLVEIARTFLDNYRARRRVDKEAGRSVQGAFIYDDLAEALAAVEKEIDNG